MIRREFRGAVGRTRDGFDTDVCRIRRGFGSMGAMGPASLWRTWLAAIVAATALVAAGFVATAWTSTGYDEACPGLHRWGDAWAEPCDGQSAAKAAGAVALVGMAGAGAAWGWRRRS
jgi:MYXO-CTERM domain-containing protein